MQALACVVGNYAVPKKASRRCWVLPAGVSSGPTQPPHKVSVLLLLLLLQPSCELPWGSTCAGTHVQGCQGGAHPCTLIDVALIDVGLIDVGLIDVGLIAVGLIDVGLIDVGLIDVALIDVALIDVALIDVALIDVGLTAVTASDRHGHVSSGVHATLPLF